MSKGTELLTIKYGNATQENLIPYIIIGSNSKILVVQCYNLSVEALIKGMCIHSRELKIGDPESVKVISNYRDGVKLVIHGLGGSCGQDLYLLLTDGEYRIFYARIYNNLK